jgi:carbonic anhydrase
VAIDEAYHGVSAALEFAVKSLKVESIVIFGHAKCGGINNLMFGNMNDTEFVGPWVNIAKKAKERTLQYFGDEDPEIQAKACEQASILLSLENLLTYPWIREKVTEGTLMLSGWYFDLDSGQLHAFNAETGTFEPVVDESVVADSK